MDFLVEIDNLVQNLGWFFPLNNNLSLLIVSIECLKPEELTAIFNLLYFGL
jgi:hypothetical protein